MTPGWGWGNHRFESELRSEDDINAGVRLRVVGEMVEELKEKISLLFLGIGEELAFPRIYRIELGFGMHHLAENINIIFKYVQVVEKKETSSNERRLSVGTGTGSGGASMFMAWVA